MAIPTTTKERKAAIQWMGSITTGKETKDVLGKETTIDRDNGGYQTVGCEVRYSRRQQQTEAWEGAVRIQEHVTSWLKQYRGDSWVLQAVKGFFQ